MELLTVKYHPIGNFYLIKCSQSLDEWRFANLLEAKAFIDMFYNGIDPECDTSFEHLKRFFSWEGREG